MILHGDMGNGFRLSPHLPAPFVDEKVCIFFLRFTHYRYRVLVVGITLLFDLGGTNHLSVRIAVSNQNGKQNSVISSQSGRASG